jgi:UPF0755 protein
VLDRMQQSMRTVLQELWETRKEGLPLKSPRDALILASIVEKETGVTSEREKVAAVYINRLKINMRLQADPTVLYGIYAETGTLPQSLTYADLEKPTPYNSYTNTGLPPTAIANPGRASIAAALNPADTKDIFFVADGKGGHSFAQTLAEHNKNVTIYRAKLRELKTSNP